MSGIQLPPAPATITKGVPLKRVLDIDASTQLANNLHYVYSAFPKEKFVNEFMHNVEELSLTHRGQKLAELMRKYLPQNYSEAVEIILKSLTPPLEKTEDNGLAPMFYMPHCQYVATYGIDPRFNEGKDPFDLSLDVQYELTQRFTCEFSIRHFLIADQERCMERLYEWISDENPHVRRLCSEGTRSRLPWAMKLKSLAEDPGPSLHILESLKDDPVLYVRRSVANHIGDIAKDHLDLALDLCESWIDGASHERKWLIRHALRYPSKKGVERALELRKRAK